MDLRPVAFTLVTLASFAALPVVAQDVDAEAERAAVEAVSDEVLAPSDTTPTVESDLPVTLPDPGAVPTADPATRLDSPEAVFVADALRDGAAAVDAAGLVRDRSDDPALRLLADRIEGDYGTIADRLRKLPGIGAVVEPRDAPVHPDAARLRALEDDAFAAAWLAVLEQHLRASIGKFESAAATTALDVPVRSAASEALTMLRAHEDAIGDLEDSLGFE